MMEDPDTAIGATVCDRRADGALISATARLQPRSWR